MMMFPNFRFFILHLQEPIMFKNQEKNLERENILPESR